MMRSSNRSTDGSLVSFRVAQGSRRATARVADNDYDLFSEAR